MDVANVPQPRRPFSDVANEDRCMWQDVAEPRRPFSDVVTMWQSLAGRSRRTKPCKPASLAVIGIR